MRRFCQGLFASVCAAALIPALALAQGQGTVQGTVLDSASGHPIPSVQVTVAGTSVGMITNAQGRFRLDGVPAGQHMVRARRIGYTTSEAAVAVTAGAVATIDIRLASSASCSSCSRSSPGWTS